MYDYIDLIKNFYNAFKSNKHNAFYSINLAELLSRMSFKEFESLNDTWIDEDVQWKNNKWEMTSKFYRLSNYLNFDLSQNFLKNQLYFVDESKILIQDPIFIIGCGHSGTSLLLTILGNHSNIYPIPKESALFLFNDEIINNKMYEWDLTALKINKKRWIEKTPPHIFQIHRLLSFRPNAKFIIMIRDGRDVVSSLSSRIGYSKIESRINRWVYDNWSGLPWINHPQFLKVKYEDLILNTDNILKKICKFLNEDYEEKMLKYYETPFFYHSNKIYKPSIVSDQNDINDLRNWQINQPLFDGRNRWINDMSQQDIKIFKNSVGQQLLQQLDYVKDSYW